MSRVAVEKGIRQDANLPCIDAPGENTFLQRYIEKHLTHHVKRDLFARYFDSPVDREEIAKAERLTLEALLRLFTETTPLCGPISYTFRGHLHQVRYTHGLCDDYHGDRFGKFGEPLTLRVYFTAEAGLPAEMFAYADWNFLDAGFPYLLGYVYGSRIGHCLFLSGIQSDMAQRYTYLFLKHDPVLVREGDGVAIRSSSDLRERFARFVPLFRKSFQRHWISTLLAGVIRYARHEGGIDEIALHQFPLEPEEDVPAHLMHRIYRGVPHKILGHPLVVRTESSEYNYHVMAVDSITRYLKETIQ